MVESFSVKIIEIVHTYYMTTYYMTTYILVTSCLMYKNGKKTKIYETSGNIIAENPVSSGLW